MSNRQRPYLSVGRVTKYNVVATGRGNPDDADAAERVRVARSMGTHP